MKGDFDYIYDPIGNRQTGTTYADMDTTRYSTTYTTNAVNQYTATSNPDESFTYNDDGNRLVPCRLWRDSLGRRMDEQHGFLAQAGSSKTVSPTRPFLPSLRI
ncbi:MAG: hypothetical protein ACUVXJ_12525 [Phycisphaerae bacterium]